MKKNEIRSYILIRHKLKTEPRIIHSELVSSLGDSSPSLRTVFRWVERFRSTGEETNDRHRVGRPITACTSANIEQVRAIIEDDPRICLNDIEVMTSLCRGTIMNIIHKHLQKRKLSSRWIPHNLTAEQKLKRLNICKQNLAMFEEGKWRLCDVITGDESWIYHRKIQKKAMNLTWVGEGETPGTVVTRNQFEPKSMICVLFKTTGPMLVDVLEKGKTIDHQYYLKNCLRPLVRSINSHRPQSNTTNIKLLHDNARPHIHKNVKNYLKSQHIKVIDHPPYSPDLAPSDFCLFDEIKRRLPDQIDQRSMKSVITEILASIPKEEYLKTFSKLIERMRLCVENKGDYFEHLIK